MCYAEYGTNSASGTATWVTGSNSDLYVVILLALVVFAVLSSLHYLDGLVQKSFRDIFCSRNALRWDCFQGE